ncbi:MAG: hypothetical protein GY928_37745 [Colwellia sp.]|nr:hypothetical protein [Colwellia sp.]
MKIKPNLPLKIKLSYAPDEHLISAWIRHNFRCGFAHFPFGTCLNYWGLPLQHIKAQRVSGSVINKIINSTSDCEHEKITVLLNRTNLGLWQLSHDDISDSQELDKCMPRANIENSEFQFKTTWHICSECVKDDKKKLGYSFWHSSHQLASVTHCLKHHQPLKTHESLNKIDKLVLPHSYLELNLDEYQNCEDLIKWSEFVIRINTSLILGEIIPEQVKANIRNHLNLPNLAKQKDQEKYQIMTDSMFSAIGDKLTNHLFKKIDGKNRNVIWRLFSGRGKQKHIMSPIYWLVVMYWLKDELNI